MIEKAALDLSRYHARYEHGDITVYLTWYLASDAGPRPVMVLTRTQVWSGRRVIPCMIPLRDAWVWSEAIGDPQRAAATAFEFARALGLDLNNVTNVFKVRSIIHDHLGDFIAMPPMPESMREKVVIGEAKLTAREHDKVVRHHEVIERV